MMGRNLLSSASAGSADPDEPESRCWWVAATPCAAHSPFSPPHVRACGATASTWAAVGNARDRRRHCVPTWPRGSSLHLITPSAAPPLRSFLREPRGRRLVSCCQSPAALFPRERWSCWAFQRTRRRGPGLSPGPRTRRGPRAEDTGRRRRRQQRPSPAAPAARELAKRRHSALPPDCRAPRPCWTGQRRPRLPSSCGHALAKAGKGMRRRTTPHPAETGSAGGPRRRHQR